jgi:deoxyribonuclease V
MSILAVDVQYEGDDLAHVAGIIISDWSDTKPIEFHRFTVEGVAPYEPGFFYKRELPCIQALLDRLKTQPDIIIVDGYVDLGVDHPGLGRHLFDALDGRVPVIGVAKTSFKDAPHVEVLHGSTSAKPLFVTAAGMGLDQASDFVKRMAGKHRIPDMLKAVDSLARGI